jgi:uncharacterized surface protein with fasciclin (FAS1) repeats
MKKNILQNRGTLQLTLLMVAIGCFVSCNKKLPEATPIIYPPVNNSSVTIGAGISSDTSYSFFLEAVNRIGMLPALSDSTKLFTVFLPNNNAFRVSGIPSTAVIDALPLASVGALVQYHIIPGEQFLSNGIATTFPNVQLPTSVTIGALPGTPLPLQLSTFPSVRATGFWDNNIPVISPDNKFQNGVIQLVAAIVNPPSELLKQALYSNPSLTYFKSAIARADSGQSGLSKLDSLLGYAVTNMTVLAPSDAAFQTLIFGLAFQAYLNAVPLPHTSTDTANAVATANGAVAAGPIFLATNNVTTAQVSGIMAYHFLATPNPVSGAFQPNIRAFSVNFSATPAYTTTLVNTVVAAHPGIRSQATFAGPFVTTLQFTGLGTFPPGGAPFSGPPATATSMDNHCVNGVYYVINQVLLPQ